MITEIHVKVHNPSPFSQLSARLGSEQFYTYCNNFYDLLMIEKPVTEDIIELVKDSLNVTSRITVNESENSLMNYLIFDCSCETSFPIVSELIMKNHGIEVTPVRYEEAWEYHQFICINKKDVSKILEELGKKFDFELLSVTDNDPYGPVKFHGFSIKQILNKLTTSQAATLIEAHEGGYYKIPRQIRLVDLAVTNKLTRYAIESRLRRAENAIMDLVLPMINFEMIRQHKTR